MQKKFINNTIKIWLLRTLYNLFRFVNEIWEVPNSSSLGKCPLQDTFLDMLLHSYYDTSNIQIFTIASTNWMTKKKKYSLNALYIYAICSSIKIFRRILSFFSYWWAWAEWMDWSSHFSLEHFILTVWILKMWPW